MRVAVGAAAARLAPSYCCMLQLARGMGLYPLVVVPLVGLLLAATAAWASDNGRAVSPPQGWRSWVREDQPGPAAAIIHRTIMCIVATS